MEQNLNTQTGQNGSNFSNTLRESVNDEVKATIVEARTLKGFRDLLPLEAEFKGEMLHALEDVFRSFGFRRIETPHLEYSESLLGQAGSEINKQVYRFKDHGDRDVALRFDLTVPFARYVVQHRSEIGMPFRRYAIGNVFRGENTQAGRYREFTQCDFDIVGKKSFNDSRSADAEIVQVMIASLERLNLSDFQVQINNRKIFNGLCEHLNLGDKTVAVLRGVDKLGKIGRDGVVTELLESGLTEEHVEAILDLVTLSEGKSAKETLRALQPYAAFGATIAEGIQELQSISDILDAVPNSVDRYRVDLSIARGLGYYTGVVFETVLSGYERFGSVCSGGRYANLASTFTHDQMPGVGASVGLDRLMAALSERDVALKPSTPATTLIALERDSDAIAVHRLAAVMRAAGHNVEIFAQVDKVGNQFSYAKRHGHRLVVRTVPGEGWNITNIDTGEKTIVLSTEQALAAMTKLK